MTRLHLNNCQSVPHMPEGVPHMPEGVPQMPGSVPHMPDAIVFYSSFRTIESTYPIFRNGKE